MTKINMENKDLTTIEKVNAEVNHELKDPASMRALIATTFKGLDEVNVKKAIIEGMIRGFSFKNFLVKDVYAIPFKDAYSLVTSIDFARKIGAKGGICGKEKPVYDMDGDRIISCEVTVKKTMENGSIGSFTAEVFFDEYKKTNDKYPTLWQTKPRTMIAKVAEMHALRMACPEELAKVYIEDEFSKEKSAPAKVSNLDAFEKAKLMIKAAGEDVLKSAIVKIEESAIFTVPQRAELTAMIEKRLNNEFEVIHTESVVEPIGEDEVGSLFDGN